MLRNSCNQKQFIKFLPSIKSKIQLVEMHSICCQYIWWTFKVNFGKQAIARNSHVSIVCLNSIESDFYKELLLTGLKAFYFILALVFFLFCREVDDKIPGEIVFVDSLCENCIHFWVLDVYFFVNAFSKVTSILLRYCLHPNVNLAQLCTFRKFHVFHFNPNITRMKPDEMHFSI